MPTVQEFDAMIHDLPLADCIALRDKLDQRIEEEFIDEDEQAIIELMERRLDDYIAGKIPSKPFDVAMAEIRKSLGL